MTTTITATTEATEYIVPCDDRCMFATGDDCDCVCGGRNHQQGERLAPEQRFIYRSNSGRRQNVLPEGTARRAYGEWLLAQRDAGFTMRALSDDTGWSVSSLRRLINEMLLTTEVEDSMVVAAHAHGEERHALAA